MSLARLPFLVSITWGIHTCMTAPYAAPPSSECMPPTGLEVVAPWFPVIVKLVFWSTALPEAAVILANNIRHSHPTVSGALIHLFIRNSQSSANDIRLTAPFIIGWAVNLFGALLRRHCYRILGKQFTFELSIREDHKLVTTGPYSIVRHPSYTGASFAALGVALCHLTAGSWLMECSALMLDSWLIWSVIWVLGLVILVTGLVPRMQKEDSMLKKRFGRQWDQWASGVPYRLFPGFV